MVHSTIRNIGDLLRGQAALTPDAPAFREGEVRLTYSQFDEETDRLARWLIAQGFATGDRIAIHWPNSIDTARLYFGIFKAGMIAVPVNSRMKQEETAYVLRQSGVRACFSAPALAEIAEAARANCPDLRWIRTALPSDCPDASTGLPTPSEADTCVLLYTSGTTARPKGVIHTHRSLLSMIRSIAAAGYDAHERSVLMTPMLHASGLFAVVLPTIFVGGEVAILPAYDPATALDAVELYRCTAILSLPALLRLIVNEQERKPRDVSSVRRVLAGGDAVPLSLQEDVKRLFGVVTQEGYAMTECCPISFNDREVRTGSIGVPATGVVMRIVDAEGNDVPDGEIGEILVRSDSCCSGYWDDPAETEKLFLDGWMRSGDLGRRDSDGFFWFEGRLKQIIIRGGSNISPVEVEEALYRHPAVLEAGVVGSPDSIYGEVPVAFIALKPGVEASEREIVDHTRPLLADYKLPERIYFRAELPKGVSGKVDRRSLQESLLAIAANA